MKYIPHYTRLCWQVFLLPAVCCLSAAGCKKLIEVDLPIDRNASETVFATTPTAVSAMTGIYANMVGDIASISLTPAQLADELKVRTPAGYLYYRNDIRVDNAWNTWIPFYRNHIYGLNSIMDGVRKSASLPGRAKAILEGEARFTRAFLYFYLVNNYGEVPLALNIDFNANANLPRASIDKVYDQIEEDLLFAQQHLDSRYLAKDLSTSADSRLRPNRGAATALLARVYLYRRHWNKAEEQASKLIDNDPNYELLTDLDGVFLKESREAIWQIQNDQLHRDGVNTQEAWQLLPSPGKDPTFYVADDLDQSYETGDQRQVHWTKQYTPTEKYFYKYKLGRGTRESKEYSVVLRLAEQFLIRAEARAEQGKLTGPNSAAEDLDRIRQRAGLGPTGAMTKEALIDAILQERRIELAAECGHRWHDLKRTGRIDARMSVVTPLKQGVWLPYKALQPIPSIEFLYNPALRGHQNPGYTEKP